ncbi:MAG: SDR family NAD(P)-dependent oxidoreductase [Pseudomonadota bacterium]
MSSEKPLEGRLLVVTGASRGLGRALALAAAGAGARLVLIARTVGGLEEVDDEARKLGAEPATLVPQDLLEVEALDRLGAVLYQRHGQLDGLILAHGMMGHLSPVGHIVPKVWEESLAVNATASYRLLRSLLPLLQQGEAPRVLAITDEAGRNKAYWAAYDASKRALEALIISLVGETQETKLKINLAAPPPMATRLRGVAFPGENQATLAQPEQIAPLLLPALYPEENRHGAILRPAL